MMCPENAALKDETGFDNSLSSKTNFQRGLCGTCKHAAVCIFPRDYHRPVLQCEEFEGEELSAERSKKPAIKLISKADLQEKARSAQYKGLCTLCAIRESCTFPKSESGVWHCEEYE